MKAQLLSCAKINLDLKILERQTNGLHEIQSNMQFIDLSDEIIIDLNASCYQLDVDGEIDCSEADNLVTKAHRALQNEVNQDLPCKIMIKKNIPLQSGLGGGSSNSATVLLALNKLFRLTLTLEKLIKIGLKLGSDIPFFIRGQSGLVFGTGELFKPKTYPLKDFSLLVPDMKSSTKDLFNTLDEQKNSLRHSSVNNFESVFFRKYELIKSTLDNLDIKNTIFLSGTGSTVFFEDQGFAELDKIAEKIPPNWRSFKCKALQYSPIYKQWGVAKR